jgi:hypothetical protein
MQKTFWQLPSSQALRLKASFTVFDKFDCNTLLKSPVGLVDAWLKATIRGKAPLAWKHVENAYWSVLKAVTGPGELTQVKDHHLLDWADTLFGNKPLDLGKTYDECWTELLSGNKDLGVDVSDEPPELFPSFLQATNPRLLQNQRAITVLAGKLATEKRSWVYVCQPTGTGKTTEMLELGYLMADECIPKSGNSVIDVHLIVPSPEQAELYQNRFAEK